MRLLVQINYMSIRYVERMVHDIVPIFLLSKFQIGRRTCNEIARCAVCERLKFADQVRLVAEAIDIRQFRQSDKRIHE